METSIEVDKSSCGLFLPTKITTKLAVNLVFGGDYSGLVYFEVTELEHEKEG